MSAWEHFDLDGAIFRRPCGGRGVTDVFDERKRVWMPYQGADKVRPFVFGDRCDDPMAKSETGEVDNPLVQAAFAEQAKRRR